MKNIREDFPILSDNQWIYLDTAASSLTPVCVIDKLAEYYRAYPVNVHRGTYRLTLKATRAYEGAREAIARFINAAPEEIIFTRGASSALNLIALSYGETHIESGDEIIVSELEHHSHLLPWQQLAKRKKATLVFVPLDEDHRISVEHFKRVLSDKTKIVALTYVSNVMGTITPLEKIIEAAHSKGAVVSVDAAQATPHMRIDVCALDCDFLAFSGHKMCGPTGIGVLYGKQKHLRAMPPLEYGGEMNEDVEKYDAQFKDIPHKFETGTPPIAEAIGLQEAVDYVQGIGFDNIARHEKMLYESAKNGLLDIDGVTLYNQTAETAILNFNVDGVHAHDAATFFDENNIALRAGHHCAQLLIRHLNVAATLRASFYFYNTFSDVERFLENVRRARVFFTDVGF